MEERLGEQNRVKHPESVETPCASSPGEQRNAAGILASFAFGLLLALGASALWGFYADGLLRDGRMRRIIQLHGFADHYESYAVSRVGGGSSGTAAVEIPSARLGYSGLRSASILFPSRLPHGSGLNADSGSLIVRYTKLSPAGSSVFFYDDTDWNKQHYNYIYAKNSIIITILSIVIIAISPIAVTLFSMFRRRDELRRFSNTAGGPSRESIHAAAMKTVIGESDVAVLILDGSGRAVSVSRAAAFLLEAGTAEDASDFSSFIALPREVREKCLSGGSPFQETVELMRASGEVNKVDIVYQPFEMEAGGGGGVLFLFPGAGETGSTSREADGVKQKQDEEILAGMVRGLAHNLNNTVAGIIGVASLGIREATVDWELAGRFRDIQREAGKLSDICSELQLLLTSGESESGICDPSYEMARISQVLRSVMPFNIAVEAGGSSRFKILVDRGILRQFFFNLALASSDRMKGAAGRIRINLSDRLPRRVLSPDLERGNRLCFRYSDGFIMPPELRDVFTGREYEPSDVERQFGASYGTAYRVSLEFGGWISFEREMGETILCLVLKGIPSDTAGEHAGVSGSVGENNLKVLLADDADLVRETLGEFLRSQDFRVVTAADGDKAMEYLGKEWFDAIILDLNMPGRPSLSIAAHCLQAYEDMAVILSSGYEKPDGIQALLDDRRVEFLPKPSPPGEMVHAVRALVAKVRRDRGDRGVRI